MVEQRIRQAETAGEEIEIAAFGPRIRVDGQPSGRVELDLLLLGACSSNQFVDIDRIGEFVGDEGFRLRPQIDHMHLVHDIRALGRVDMAVGLGCGDHGADQRQGEIIGESRRLQAEGRSCRGRKDLRLLLHRRLRCLAGLVVLVGEIAEAGDRGDAADGRDVAGELTARLGAEDGGSKARRLQGIVLCDFAELAGLAEHASGLAGHLRSEELVKKLFGVEHRYLLLMEFSRR